MEGAVYLTDLMRGRRAIVGEPSRLTDGVLHPLGSGVDMNAPDDLVGDGLRGGFDGLIGHGDLSRCQGRYLADRVTKV